jgi:hypothetical protein
MEHATKNAGTVSKTLPQTKKALPSKSSRLLLRLRKTERDMAKAIQTVCRRRRIAGSSRATFAKLFRETFEELG